jgi:ATP-binding cassette, subfamily F, member 3
VALAQFEGTLVLVSHDRHLLRATTEKLLIVANGRLAEFDGDLDDYRDSLLKRDAAPKPAKPQKPAAAPKPRPTSKKPLEARIKRLEEIMSRLNAQKASIEARLADPALYQDQEALKALLQDQAYVAREIEEVETEWLQKQAELEQP